MLSLLFATLIVPALPAGAIAVLLPRGPGVGRIRSSALFAVAISAGILTSYRGVYGWPVLSPASAHEWIPHAVLASVLVFGALDSIAFRGRDRGADAWIPALPLLVVATGTSLVSMMGYSASLSQQAAGIAAALGACVVAHFLRRNLRLGPGPVGVTTVAIGLVLYIGWRFAEVGTPSFSLLLLGLAGAVFSPVGRRRPTRPFVDAAIRIAIPAIPVAVSVLLAYLQYEPSPY